MPIQKMNGLQNSSCESDKMQVLKSNGSKPTKCINDSHAVQIVKGLQSLRKDEVLCDIKLEADDGTIVVAHKNVLISASPYFRAMFSSFYESNKDVVNIRELDSSVLELLVDYIYSGEILVTKENVQVLLPAADLLQLDFVSILCEDFMKKQLDISNCLGTYAFADLHFCMELFSSSEAYIKKHFLAVIECDEFLSLSFEEIIKLISHNDLAVPLEEKVFEGVIKWIKHELGSRENFLLELMKHVRLPLLASVPNILKLVFEEHLLKNTSIYNDYVLEMIPLNLLNLKQHFTIPQTIRSTPRHYYGLQKVILTLNQPNTISQKSYTEWYDPSTKLWKKAPQMSNCRKNSALCLIRDRFVFAVGGVNGSSSKSVTMLDLTSRSPSWVPMLNMLVSRQYLGIGILEDCIYAVGGHDGISSLNSSEVFDVSIQKWKMISNMSTNRRNFGVGILDNLLYAVGGDDGSIHLKSVECYDHTLDTWTSVEEMSVSRLGAGVEVLDGTLYAVGGCSGCTCLKSVEAFNSTAKMWSFIADMHLPRYCPVVVTLDGLLYVMGGYDGSSFLHSFEIYNPITNTWSMESLSRNGIQIYGAVVVDILPQFLTS